MPSFREFLEILEQEGELIEINEEIDCDLKPAAICAASQRAGGPAVLFSNIKGYPGMKMVGSLFTGPGFMYWPQVPRLMHGRIALGMGLEKDISYKELQETVIERKKGIIRALEVSSGPCQEVKKSYSEVNLNEFPIPYLHDRDGGRYLTSGVMITRDPEEKWINLGVYRAMVAGKNTLVHGGLHRRTTPTHIERMVQKAAQKNEPLPFAIAIGVPPTVYMAACCDLPPRSDEYAVAGGLGSAPIPVVKAQLSDLLVPADAEVVLEGHIYPGEQVEEGPFAGISYYTPKMNNFVYRVEMITHREDPILPFVAEGCKPSDSMCLISVFHSAELLERCRMFVQGVPVEWLTLPVEAKLTLAIVGFGKQGIPGLPGRAGRTIYSGSPYVRQVIVVDATTIPEQLSVHVNDRSQKVNYGERVWIVPDKPAGLTENHDFETNLSSTMTVDATWRLDRAPETYAVRIDVDTCLPEEVQQQVVELWNKWGIKPDPVVMKK